MCDLVVSLPSQVFPMLFLGVVLFGVVALRVFAGVLFFADLLLGFPLVPVVVFAFLALFFYYVLVAFSIFVGRCIAWVLGGIRMVAMFVFPF